MSRKDGICHCTVGRAHTGLTHGLVSREVLQGGEADNQPDSKYDAKQMKMGVDMEREHTTDPGIAKEIAKDHLEEIPDYYTRLRQMEAEAEKEEE